jgi:hypothetical protein
MLNPCWGLVADGGNLGISKIDHQVAAMQKYKGSALSIQELVFKNCYP